eukprot:5006422-Amphidinium_carterae.1
MDARVFVKVQTLRHTSFTVDLHVVLAPGAGDDTDTLHTGRMDENVNWHTIPTSNGILKYMSC